MASEEHKVLAEYLKNTHAMLRNASQTFGPEKAWTEHCEDSQTLKEYAKCMQKLATTHWETAETTNRIEWTAEFCNTYFTSLISTHRIKEDNIAAKISVPLCIEGPFISPYKLLDVGSCYNPFKQYSFFEVFPIDLCPANESVYECDFLHINLDQSTKVVNNKVVNLKLESFDILTFCFVLEYIPSSELRIQACQNAYKVLKYGGIMIITTPDSKHVGANCKIMKCWQYTMASIGFVRIKYEKFNHMHCMAFRKAANIDIAKRWAVLHKKDYMEVALHIPQDFQIQHKININKDFDIVHEHDFTNMPFCDTLLENDLTLE